MDAGSFSAAAQRLSLTQPAVSQHIKAAERMFGGALLDRSTTPPSMTPLGVRVMPHIRDCVLAYRKARHDAVADPYREKNYLRVGAAFSLGEYLIPPLISAFRREHQSIRISVQVNKQRDIVRMAMAQGCDVAIVPLVRDLPDYHRLVTLPLVEEAFILAVPIDHPWRQLGRVPARCLREEPLILRETGSVTRRLMDSAFEQIGGLEDIQVVMEMATNEAIKQTIRAGLGIGFVSALSLSEDLAQGRLATVAVEGLSIRRWLQVVHARVQPLSPAVRAFLQFIRTSEGLPWRAT